MCNVFRSICAVRNVFLLRIDSNGHKNCNFLFLRSKDNSWRINLCRIKGAESLQELTDSIRPAKIKPQKADVNHSQVEVPDGKLICPEPDERTTGVSCGQIYMVWKKRKNARKSWHERKKGLMNARKSGHYHYSPCPYWECCLFKHRQLI